MNSKHDINRARAARRAELRRERKQRMNASRENRKANTDDTQSNDDAAAQPTGGAATEDTSVKSDLGRPPWVRDDVEDAEIIENDAKPDAPEEARRESQTLRDKLAAMFANHQGYEVIDDYRQQLIQMRGGEDNLRPEDHQLLENMADLIDAEQAKHIET